MKHQTKNSSAAQSKEAAKNPSKPDSLKKVLSVLKLSLILVIILGIPLILYFYYPEVLDQFRTAENINALLDRYPVSSALVFIGLQIFQVIVTFIPGEFTQLAGGFAFGLWIGYIMSILGLAFGTIGAFYIARGLGRNAMHVLFGEERLAKYVYKLNSKKGLAILFVLYLLPGIPKDLLAYAAGVSEIRFKPFFIVSLVGRSPALLVSLWMGAMLQKGHYTDMVLLAVLTAVVALILFLKRHALTGLTDRIYEKLVS